MLVAFALRMLAKVCGASGKFGFDDLCLAGCVVSLDSAFLCNLHRRISYADSFLLTLGFMFSIYDFCTHS